VYRAIVAIVSPCHRPFVHVAMHVTALA